MKTLFTVLFSLFMVGGRPSTAAAVQKSPFVVSAALGEGSEAARLSVTLTVPAGHYLYADRIAVKPAAEGVKLAPRDIPAAKTKHDTFSGSDAAIYEHDVTFTFTVTPTPDKDLAILVDFQGCNETLCFLPRTEKLLVSHGQTPTAAEPAQVEKTPASPAGDWQIRLRDRFTVVGRAAGYVREKDFVEFLDRSKTATEVSPDWLLTAFKRRGPWVAALLILLGGMALNFTPCVLPMIPVNIAIIGAGVEAGSRRRGFALGSAYGAGIALVYGALGLLVVLTGARFGTLNSNPWFNLAIAAIFLVMGLAMIDLLHVDFSRFQGAIGTRTFKRGSYAAALLMGGIAALLAGACVAPVVISVLLLSAGLYASGSLAGLLLPFLLGAGMALPWPFAGAGLSFLPKPGKWMERVKVVFAAIILLIAIYYGHVALSLFRSRGPQPAAIETSTQGTASAAGWHTSMADALTEAERDGKPVLIDFWASWCKNCLVMDETTLRSPDVLRRLDGFVKVKYRAEDFSAPETRAVLDVFEVPGLPTYVILRPADTGLKPPTVRQEDGRK